MAWFRADKRKLRSLKALTKEFKKRGIMYDETLNKTAQVAVKRDPAKWARAKAQAKAKMGGKHSARAMQLATQIYKRVAELMQVRNRLHPRIS